jgi:hypothetical protein
MWCTVLTVIKNQVCNFNMFGATAYNKIMNYEILSQDFPEKS